MRKQVLVTQLDDGSTIMRAKTRSIMDLRGMLKPARRRKVAIDEMAIGRD